MAATRAKGHGLRKRHMIDAIDRSIAWYESISRRPTTGPVQAACEAIAGQTPVGTCSGSDPAVRPPGHAPVQIARPPRQQDRTARSSGRPTPIRCARRPALDVHHAQPGCSAVRLSNRAMSRALAHVRPASPVPTRRYDLANPVLVGRDEIEDGAAANHKRRAHYAGEAEHPRLPDRRVQA